MKHRNVRLLGTLTHKVQMPADWNYSRETAAAVKLRELDAEVTALVARRVAEISPELTVKA